MTDKRNNILIIAGGSPRNITQAKHINKVIKIFNALNQNIYLISYCDEDLIEIKKDDIYKIQIYQNRYEQFIKSQFLELKILYKIFKKKKIDIVFFAFGHDLFLVPILFSKLMRKKIILRSDGRPSLVCEKYLQDQFLFKKKLFRIIEFFNYNLVDTLVSECNYMLKENNQDHLRNCGIANLPINMNFYKRKNPIENRKYDLGFIGRFLKEKGIINFIETISLLVKNNNNISVFIGGGGDLKEEINQFLVNNNLETYVQLVDWIQDTDLPDYLNSIKVFVFPSSREGLPNIILEAMACGTIVLSTPVGGVPGVIIDGETGFIMENNSIPCIAHNIFRVLNHPNLEKISINAYNLINNEYSFESTLIRYDEIIERFK